ncbi:MAG TPA: hypothetical protein VLR29_08135, partial [Flavobacterium sp.]|nr:hypothetical protein [Flavobacterium sp.]
MQTDKILVTAIVGTSAMTLFSYLASESKNRNFREPEILGQLINRLPTRCSKESSQIAGWCTHYAVGLAFVVIYDKLWKKKKLEPSVTSGLLLGAASGLVGIGGWKVMFEVHPNPPVIKQKRFFGHLMLAHIVFGVFSAVTYK